MKSLILGNTFLITILLIMSACTSGDGRDIDITLKDTLNINIGTEPPTLDWSRATDSTSFTILNNIMEGLTRFSSDHRAVPALAERWDISDDGKEYIFYIRRGVKWTDGKELTAHDFVYSWRRLLTPETAASYAYFLYDIKNAREFNSGMITDFSQVGIEAIDDYTLRVELQKPVIYFPSVLTFMSTFPMREDVVNLYGDSWTKPENIQTLGPYRVTEWRHHNYMVIEEYSDYWDENPKDAKRVRMIMNENPTSVLALYESGQLDFLDSTGMPLLEIPRLRQSDEFTSKLAYRGSYIAFNVTREPFDNPLVRKALGHAIDRESIVMLIQGAGIPLSSWIPKNMLGHNPDIGLEFDPVKARKLLAEAGYPEGRGFPNAGFLYPDIASNRIVAQAIQSMWRSHLGINIRLINQEWKVYLRTVNTNPPEIFRGSWGADYPDPHNFMNLFKCTSGNNRTRWCNPEYDEIVDRAAMEQDTRKREALYDKAQTILTETDAPVVPYLNAIQQNMIKPYVRGLEPDPLNLIYFRNVEFVTPEKEKAQTAGH